jgi:hypothetical protein
LARFGGLKEERFVNIYRNQLMHLVITRGN